MRGQTHGAARAGHAASTGAADHSWNRTTYVASPSGPTAPRSQVARSACSTLTAVASHVGDHPALDRPMRESVLPTLLTLAGNGNKVLAGAGRECLPELFDHCHFAGLLKVVAAALMADLEAVRAVADAAAAQIEELRAALAASAEEARAAKAAAAEAVAAVEAFERAEAAERQLV